MSGIIASRPELNNLLSQLRAGDTVYIYKLDRLGRSLKHLLQLVGELQQRGIRLASLTDAINTTSAQGWLVFNLFASLSEFEWELIRERPHVGLASARAWGRGSGRQWGLSKQAERLLSLKLSIGSSSRVSMRLPSACISPKVRFISTPMRTSSG